MRYNRSILTQGEEGMFKTFEQDRYFIEGKYHNPDEEFNSFARWNYHGYSYDENTGLSDEEMQNGLKALAESLCDQPRPIQKARYFAYVLDHTRIDVNKHDYFIGIWSWNRPLSPHSVYKWDLEVRKSDLASLDKIGLFDRSGTAFGFLDFDHTVPDWDSLLTLGFPGILQRLHAGYQALEKQGGVTQKQTEFYQACVTEYEAIVRLLDRLYQYALTKTHDKAEKYAACLKHLRDGAPTDIYEAMQLIYLYFMLSESVEHYQVRSLGYGLDSSLYPFFLKDIQSGKYTKDEVEELLAYFLTQWSAIGNYWGQPLYLGGRDRQGNCKINELSYLILDVYDKLGLYNPKIQIKVSENTPKEFVYRALKMIQGGHTSLVLCNDEMIVKCLMSRGESYQSALDSVISGCYEYRPKPGGIGISGFYVNALKPVSYVFDNGFDRHTNRQIGLHTGEIENLKTFEDFYAAYLRQFEYITIAYMEALHPFEKQIQKINPSLMFSSTLQACVSTMTDATDNAVNNTSTLLLSGLGTAVDALMAVYELVYEKKTTTLAELKKALENDWVGYEILQRKALRCKHKYGRGDELADHYAAALVRHFSNFLSGRKNGHGCGYAFELHSARAFIMQGDKTLATPDGRKFGEELSKNASPHPGMDTNGITALIHSATTIDTVLPNVGFCLDVMLHPTTVQGENGLDVLYQVMRTYMDKGGQSIHFNIFNADLLRDAQTSPEKYENLQVRVCGWNVRWNDMPKAEQDAYILRAESITQ